MSWSWSHTAEAYDNARQNVYAQSSEWLRVVWAEWEANVTTTDEDGNESTDFDSAKYDEALAKAQTLDDEALADEIWERMSEQAICDNGGFNAHCCPFGCGCHSVPFDLTDEAAANLSE